MTFNQLRTFLAVVETGSVRAAAERLFVSQPSVSGVVASLERELGVELVARAGRGLRVTPAGDAFAAAVRGGLGQIDLAVRAAQSVDEPGAGTVRIAAVTTAAERLLLPLLAGFRREHPRADVTVRVGNRTSVWEMLRDHDVDLVVAGRPPPSSRTLGRADNSLVLVGAPRPHAAPTTASRAGVVAALAGATWLLREEGSGTRDATDELLVNLGLDPRRMVLGSNGAVEQAAIAGFGVALISRDAVEAALRSGQLVNRDCPGTPLDRPWHLVGASDVKLTPTADLAARSLLRARGGFTPTADGRRLSRETARAKRPSR
ncbi:MAG: LysR family transcriptional regulator [Acidimicrobiales bacterium]